MKEYIKKVATGPKGNEDLTLDEAREMMRELLSSNVSNVEKASFLVGWRLKPETDTEFSGAFSVLLEKTKITLIEKSFELGFPFDGKNNSPYLFPLIGKMLKTEGINIVVTGDEIIPAKDGVTVKMLHEKLIGSHYEGSYHYFDRSEYLREFSDLSLLRNQIGLRTALNTLEKFSGVAKSSHAATGVFHKPYVDKYAAIFQNHLQRFLLVSGNEGSPEVAKKSRYWIIEGEKRDEYVLDPEEFGLSALTLDEDLTLDQAVSLLKDPPRNMCLMAALNAALYLTVIKPETALKENFQLLSGRI